MDRGSGYVALAQFFDRAVRSALTEGADASTLRARLERSFFGRCARGQVTLVGAKIGSGGQSSGSVREEIPTSFFSEVDSISWSQDRGVLEGSGRGHASSSFCSIEIEESFAEFVTEDFRREVNQDIIDQLIEDVRIKRRTPEDAEAEAARLGLEPLNPPPDRDALDPSKVDLWTFAMAGAWIAWRDLDRVREQWRPWREQVHDWKCARTPGNLDGAARQAKCFRHLDRRWKQPHGSWRKLMLDLVIEAAPEGSSRMSAGDVERELWDAFRNEKSSLMATGVDSLTGRRVQIPAIEFVDLKCWGEGKRIDYLAIDPALPMYEEPLLSRQRVMKLWRPQRRAASIRAEAQCRVLLIGAMKVNPEASNEPKLAWYRKISKQIEGLGDPEQSEPSEPFNRAWRDALKKSGAKWNSAGRKSGSKNRGAK